MPVALSYPGVYVDERPSGVRTITGVATSITAFVGRAAAGPTDDPQMLTSFADYERQFGGLAVDCPMSYAVRDFYLNGGAMALVVRVTHDDAATATITLTGTGSPSADLVLDAASAGGWGNRLAAAVDYDSDRALPRTSPPSTDDTRFNLTVRYQPRAGREDFVVEIFRAVSTHPDDPRYLPRVLERESSYVRMNGTMPPTRPQSNVTTAGSTRTVSWVSAQHGGDGSPLDDDDVLGSQDSKTGIYALNRADLFNLLCIPPLGRDTTGFPSNYTAVPQGSTRRR
ncbi:hypothetical protein [Ralstonia solanacearum]|uniref:hypothetical protein n=1 Tax=Ralstonia solanacearum TaxID=305 RepID=UPI001FEE5245|nr:hypothetical protein [Ralstonia solanacearum]